MKNQKGFSLIELLIVVVIIGIIAAIAVPNLLAARRSANESSTVSTLRTIHGAQMTYQSTTGAGNFVGNSGNGLPALANLNLVDNAIGAGTKNGYRFASYAQPPTSGRVATFVAGADTLTKTGTGQTGTREFLIATEGVIYGDPVSGSMGWNADSGNVVITGGAPVGNS